MFRTRSVAALAALVLGLSFASAQPDAGKLRFEVYKGKDSNFHWRLKTPDGAVIANCGKGYKVAADTKEGIDLVKNAAADDRMKFDLFENGDKEFRWRLVDGNGAVVATSGVGFRTREDAEKAVAAVRAHARTAELVEVKH
jgi:uncharacterized protein YegP (UPF0339 family)